MNRRQVLRNGALAITGLTAAGTGLLRPDLSLAQQAETTTKQPPDLQEDGPRFGSRPGFIYPVTTSVPTKREEQTKLLEFTTLTATALEASPQVTLYTRESESLSFAGQSETVSKQELKDQFIVFQYDLVGNEPTLIEATGVTPTIETDPEKNPDIALSVNLESFHVAESEGVDSDAKASVRLTVGDEDPAGGVADPLFWAVTAGVNLYDARNKRPSIPADLKSNFMKSLNSRPIALQGAVGSLRFEVIKHENPTWWERIFDFAKSDPGKLLISTLGFPAIVEQAVNFVDEAASRFRSAKAKPLMASHKLPIVFSKQARKIYEAGGPVKIGALNPGRWILARGEDFATLKNAKVWFNATYGTLIPSGVAVEETFEKGYKNPFANISYAILNAKVTPTKINPFNG